MPPNISIVRMDYCILCNAPHQVDMRITLCEHHGTSDTTSDTRSRQRNHLEGFDRRAICPLTSTSSFPASASERTCTAEYSDSDLPDSEEEFWNPQHEDTSPPFSHTRASRRTDPRHPTARSESHEPQPRRSLSYIPSAGILISYGGPSNEPASKITIYSFRDATEAVRDLEGAYSLLGIFNNPNPRVYPTSRNSNDNNDQSSQERRGEPVHGSQGESPNVVEDEPSRGRGNRNLWQRD
ncbi:hypothetical protein F5B20DRAFT_523775 [Whalleya microplaca]|nr:hypothetical protein F5B20DRAFT_523775 [Whalleya microplaca]